MAHQEAGNAEQAREYLNKANPWTDEVLADEENPPPCNRRAPWNRRATLELLSELASCRISRQHRAPEH